MTFLSPLGRGGGGRGYQGLISFHQGTIISDRRISQSQMMHLLTQTSKDPRVAPGRGGGEAGSLRPSVVERVQAPCPHSRSPLKRVPKAEPVDLTRAARAPETYSVPALISLPASRSQEEVGPVPLWMRKEPVLLALGSSSWHHSRPFCQLGQWF